MKVLIVRTFPDILQLNAYNVQEIGLAKALICRGIECGVVLYHGKNPDKTEEYEFYRQGQRYSFPVYWLKGCNILKNGFLFSLNEIIAGYDVIQVHEYDQILSWKLYSNPQKPTLLYHGPYYAEFTKGYNLKCRVFDTLFLPRRKIDHVVALTKSEFASDFLRKKGFCHVQTVGVGIDKDNFIEDVEQTVPVLPPKDESKIRLLYVGKIEERRNVYFLIQLFEALRRENEDFELVIIGNGEEQYLNSFLERIRTWTDSGAIMYFRQATQKELAEVYKNANLFLFTTNYDIFGMVLLEAMYFELPVISSMNGGASVLIEDGVNGYVIEEFHVQKWVEKVKNVFKDPERYKQMKRNAHKTIASRFLWDELADRFMEGYQSAQPLFEDRHTK